MKNVNFNGCDDYYQVTEDGRVWSNRTKKFMALMDSTKGGYKQVALFNGFKERKTIAIHRLVALSYLGDPPSDEYEVCHKDGNPKNNHYSNLYWGTRKDNMQDKTKHGTHHLTQRTHCPFGHPLEEFNLCLFQLRVGKRTCKACYMGRKYTRKHPELNLEPKVVSDRYYNLYLSEQ